MLRILLKQKTALLSTACVTCVCVHPLHPIKPSLHPRYTRCSLLHPIIPCYTSNDPVKPPLDSVTPPSHLVVRCCTLLHPVTPSYTPIKACSTLLYPVLLHLIRPCCGLILPKQNTALFPLSVCSSVRPQM